jgi:hypothetical protein
MIVKSFFGKNDPMETIERGYLQYLADHPGNDRHFLWFCMRKEGPMVLDACGLSSTSIDEARKDAHAVAVQYGIYDALGDPFEVYCDYYCRNCGVWVNKTLRKVLKGFCGDVDDLLARARAADEAKENATVVMAGGFDDCT